MRRRVAEAERAIAGACQHLAVGAHHHGADRNLAQVARAYRLGEREIHRPGGLASHAVICKLALHGRQSGGQSEPGSSPADGQGQAAGGEPSDSMRIAKAIAHAGLCSRRDAEAWIAAGRVAVNGTVLTTPATVVNPSDTITVDGKPLPQAEAPRLWRYHKRRGLVTSHKDPQGRKTVFEALPPGLPRVVSVGRLDINTEGLLLLTTDGELARHLELPSTGWLRRYRVRAHGRVGQEELDRLRQGHRPSTACITGRWRRGSTASKGAMSG